MNSETNHQSCVKGLVSTGFRQDRSGTGVVQDGIAMIRLERAPRTADQLEQLPNAVNDVQKRHKVVQIQVII